MTLLQSVRRLTVFDSLHNRDFRWFWLARLAHSASMEMGNVAMGWLAYQLTGSALARIVRAAAAALAIGGAFAAGAGALGTFLVMGFTIHNLTEGIGIAAPMVRERPRWPVWVGLVALAGLPAVLGTWIGAYAFAPHWTVLFLGIGAGAILQVVVEVAVHLRRKAAEHGATGLSATSVGGFATGVGVMYATALLVQV